MDWGRLGLGLGTFGISETGNILSKGKDLVKNAVTNDYQANYQPVTPEQLAASQNTVNSNLGQQQQFVNALQGQNGIGNQSSVYNQLQGIASGQGPNLARSTLNQATGQNIANQAALMASSRGAGANAGLMARQAAMQGGALQQQAVGQGAMLQGQQTLGALGQMGGLATQQVNQQGQALQGLNQYGLQNQQTLLGASNAANASNQQINAGVAAQNQQTYNNIMGGIANAIGSGAMTMAGGGAGGAGGGMMKMPGMAHGGEVPGPRSAVGRHFAMMAQGGMAVVPGQAKVSGDSLKNDTVPALLSPKEIVLPRSVTLAKDAPAKAAEFVRAILAKKGR
jgi:hypothetical protein